MKKLSFVIVLLLLMIVSSCEEEYVVRPIERDDGLFEVYYETDEYTIMKQVVIDTEVVYPMVAYGVGDGYFLGEYHKENYYVVYEGMNYYLDDGVRLGLYMGEELKELGIEQMNYACNIGEEQ